MRYLQTFLILLFAVCFSNVNAQGPLPPDAMGTWKIVNVYAKDSTGTTDSLESAALMDDLVNDNVVEYEFTDSTFTLIINNTSAGTCFYTQYEGLITFDANGENLSEIVNDLKGISLTTTNFEMEASSPDGDGVTFYQSLVKQP